MVKGFEIVRHMKKKFPFKCLCLQSVQSNVIRKKIGHGKGREFPRVGNTALPPVLLHAAATAARQQRLTWPKFGHISKKNYFIFSFNFFQNSKKIFFN